MKAYARSPADMRCSGRPRSHSGTFSTSSRSRIAVSRVSAMKNPPPAASPTTRLCNAVKPPFAAIRTTPRVAQLTAIPARGIPAARRSWGTARRATTSRRAGQARNRQDKCGSSEELQAEGAKQEGFKRPRGKRGQAHEQCGCRRGAGGGAHSPRRSDARAYPQEPRKHDVVDQRECEDDPEQAHARSAPFTRRTSRAAPAR